MLNGLQSGSLRAGSKKKKKGHDEIDDDGGDDDGHGYDSDVGSGREGSHDHHDNTMTKYDTVVLWFWDDHNLKIPPCHDHLTNCATR